jgi:hypothetical protein
MNISPRLLFVGYAAAKDAIACARAQLAGCPRVSEIADRCSDLSELSDRLGDLGPSDFTKMFQMES